jgi:NH3-dependent NAD+ synthetase
MWNINELITKLKINSKIGLFISGGFDSSTLAYLICDIIADQKLTIDLNIITIPRYDDSWRHSENIIVWLEQKFQIKLNHLCVGNPNLHHSEQVKSGIEFMRKLDPAMLLILADTRNPPNELQDTGPVRIRSSSPLIYQPWFDLNKTEVIKLAQNLNVLNEIAKLSHTCTESIELRCNYCWQCQERRWAFKNLNIIDLGNK